eukprot:INCI14601.1.p1 GENE.INCI14601.1~~INCI14601.1.p1  ORF type:complete len:1269 (-),score=256.90 INCI14601.1:272-4078(-)
MDNNIDSPPVATQPRIAHSISASSTASSDLDDLSVTDGEDLTPAQTPTDGSQVRDSLRSDPSALLRELGLQKKRRYSVKELISTEKTYVYNLRIVVESIMKPLLDLAANPRKPTIVAAKMVKKIFRNIDMILGFNENLLKTLTATPAVENRVGKIFCKFAPFFKMYSAYIDGAEASMEAVHNLEETNKLFAQFSHKIVRTVAGGSLNSLLIEPVQRIPRYLMLLKDILKCTRSNHRDYKYLVKAAEKVQAAAQHCDEQVEWSKKMQASIKVMRRLRNGEVLPQALQHREILREGSLRKVDRRGTLQKRRVILFTDLLVYGTKHHNNQITITKVMPLEPLGVFNHDKSNACAFTVVSATTNKQTKLVARDQEDCNAWVEAIREAQREQISRLRSAVGVCTPRQATPGSEQSDVDPSDVDTDSPELGSRRKSAMPGLDLSVNTDASNAVRARAELILQSMSPRARAGASKGSGAYSLYKVVKEKREQNLRELQAMREAAAAHLEKTNPQAAAAAAAAAAQAAKELADEKAATPVMQLGGSGNGGRPRSFNSRGYASPDDDDPLNLADQDKPRSMTMDSSCSSNSSSTSGTHSSTGRTRLSSGLSVSTERAAEPSSRRDSTNSQMQPRLEFLESPKHQQMMFALEAFLTDISSSTPEPPESSACRNAGELGPSTPDQAEDGVCVATADADRLVDAVIEEEEANLRRRASSDDAATRRKRHSVQSFLSRVSGDKAFLKRFYFNQMEAGQRASLGASGESQSSTHRARPLSMIERFPPPPRDQLQTHRNRSASALASSGTSTNCANSLPSPPVEVATNFQLFRSRSRTDSGRSVSIRRAISKASRRTSSTNTSNGAASGLGLAVRRSRTASDILTEREARSTNVWLRTVVGGGQRGASGLKTQDLGAPVKSSAGAVAAIRRTSATAGLRAKIEAANSKAPEVAATTPKADLGSPLIRAALAFGFSAMSDAEQASEKMVQHSTARAIAKHIINRCSDEEKCVDDNSKRSRPPSVSHLDLDLTGATPEDMVAVKSPKVDWSPRRPPRHRGSGKFQLLRRTSAGNLRALRDRRGSDSSYASTTSAGDGLRGLADSMMNLLDAAMEMAAGGDADGSASNETTSVSVTVDKAGGAADESKSDLHTAADRFSAALHVKLHGNGASATMTLEQGKAPQSPRVTQLRKGSSMEDVASPPPTPPPRHIRGTFSEENPKLEPPNNANGQQGQPSTTWKHDFERKRLVRAVFSEPVDLLRWGEENAAELPAPPPQWDDLDGEDF